MLSTPCCTLGVLGLDGGASTGEPGVFICCIIVYIIHYLCDLCDGAIAIDIWGDRHASALKFGCLVSTA